MHKVYRLRALVVVLPVLIASRLVAAGEDGPATLRWKLTRGESMEWNLLQTKDSVITGEESLNYGERHEMTFQCQVLDVDDQGDAKIKLTTRRVQVSLTNGDKKLAYDSQDPTPPLPYKEILPFTFLAGVAVEGRLTSRGLLTDLKVVEAPAASGPQPAQVDRFRQLALTTVFDQVKCLLPPQPVRAGDEWKQDLKLPSPKKMETIHARYVFGGMEMLDGKPKAKISASFEPNLILPAMAPGIAVEFVKNECGQTTWFDLERQRIESSETASHLIFDFQTKGSSRAEIKFRSELRCRGG